MIDPVRHALINTPHDYLIRTLRQRCIADELQLGSYFNIDNIHTLLGHLILATWEPYAHPAVQEPARGYRAQMPGMCGVIHINDLKPEERIVVLNPKGLHGQAVVSPRFGGTLHPPVRVGVTVALVGPGAELGVEGDILWTVHPGDPVIPSELPQHLTNRTFDLTTARSLGVEWVKVAP